MNLNTPPVVFFDIGDTLGTVRIAPTNDRIEGIHVLPKVFDVLEELKEMGARLGTISNRGNIPALEVNRALDQAGLYAHFEPDLIIYGKKDTVDIFNKAAQKAGSTLPPRNCLFVGENENERNVARSAGFLTADRPIAAPDIVSTLIGTVDS